MASRTALMLDFDGVLMKNQRVHKYIRHKCTEYLAKRARLPYTEADRVNRSRYPVHGHTAWVLERDYNVPCKPKEFNRVIYDESIDYPYVLSMLTDQDAEYAKNVIAKFGGAADAFVFSNATKRWIREISRALDLSFPDERIVASDLVGHFKPDPRAFAEAEFLVRLVAPSVESFCLVDDSIPNVKTAMVLPKWRGMLFD